MLAETLYVGCGWCSPAALNIKSVERKTPIFLSVSGSKRKERIE
jgi:hypothetical protein